MIESDALIPADALPEGFKMTELGPLPEEWQVVRLGEVVSAKKGRKPDKVTDVASGGSLPYLTAEYFRSNVPTQFVPSNYLTRTEICSASDVVLIWDGSKAGQVFTGLQGVLASTMVKVVPVDQNLHKVFLYFYLLAHFETFNSQTTGSTIPHVSKTLFLNLPIPLPPLAEQRAIAHVLRTVQEAKEATERVITALKELKKSLMRHLFTYGPGPVDKIGAVPMQETEIGPMPTHWRVVKLGEVGIKFFGGGTPSTSKPEYWGGNIPWTTSAHIDGLYLSKGARSITKEGLNNSSSNLVPSGNLLIGTRVGVGKVTINLIDVAISQDLTAVIIDKTRVVPEFLAYSLLDDRSQSFFRTAARGVTIKGIPRDDLTQIPLPLPPLPEQQEIARMLQAVDEKIAAEERRRSALLTLFKSLLAQLMSGRVRVPKEWVAQFAQEAPGSSTIRRSIIAGPSA